jgi:hypothetical protein
MADREPDVVLLDHGVIAEIRLNRASARNALSTGLAEALAATAGRSVTPEPERSCSARRHPRRSASGRI